MKLNKPILYALASAFLFGISTPVAKQFLGHIQPQLLAGLLYLGSGFGLAILLALKTCFSKEQEKLQLKTVDAFWLAGAILSGGIVAPVLLMNGLSGVQAGNASLLLNLEAVFTAILAWFVFKENFDRRIFLGMVAIVAGGILISWNSSSNFTFNIPTSNLLILTACFCWGIDNNLTRKISACDPLFIATIKGLVAGLINLSISLTGGALLPESITTAKILLIGFASYGASLWLFILSLRYLGTARTSAYFSTAPFVGAAVSMILFHEPLTSNLAAAAVLMAIGVWLHLTENHEHEHLHEALAHAHSHTHDDHHQHNHNESESADEPHSHWHIHEQITHSHAHFPDIHHRHPH